MAARLIKITKQYFAEYQKKCTIDIYNEFRRLQRKGSFSPEDFGYYFLASSLYSSKIEGNSLDHNSFFRKRNQAGAGRKGKEVLEIEYLAKAYNFAKDHPLTLTNFLQTHGILSTTLLKPKERGKIRTDQVGVFDNVTMRPVYMAVEPEYVKRELTRLFQDIDVLLKRKLTYKEVFYYASMVHLWVAKIHPFADGNGRSARLAEKWFICQHLGTAAWAINSEKYYWDHRPEYYQNVALGYNYYVLHWERCMPFLMMLPDSASR